MKRIEDLFVSMLSDESMVSVGMVTRTFTTIFTLGEQNLDSFKNVKERLTVGEWNAFVNAISSSFLTTIYINSAESKEERERRVGEVTMASNGFLKGVVEA